MKHKKILIVSIIGLCCLLGMYCPWPAGVRAALTAGLPSDLWNPGKNTLTTAYPFPRADQTTYQMDLYLDAINRIVYGQSQIKTINTSGRVLGELWLAIYPQAFQDPGSSPAPSAAYAQGFSSGGIQIKQVKVNGVPSEFITEDICMKVMLPSDMLPEEELTVDISWQAEVPRVAYRYGTADGVFMLGHFYPTLNAMSDSGWCRPLNSPFGDPFCLSAASYLVRINLPQDYRLITSGELIASLALDNGRENHLIKAELVRDFSLTACSRYEKLEQAEKNITLKCFLPPDMQAKGREIIKQAGQIVQYYNCLWGTYPYGELSVVVVPMQGFSGMEYAGVVYISEDQLDHPGVVTLLAHEIAHQWWYGLVGNDQYDEPWLDEGLAEYSATLYINHVQGQDQAQLSPGIAKRVNLDRALPDFVSDEQYRQVAYQGGEDFWLALEQELGRDKVQKILRSYLANYKHQLVTSQDLERVINQEAHRDMSAFFAAWSL
jgi:hypothetical protein